MHLKKALVIDGSYVLHRNLHVEHLFELRSHEGEGPRTGGIFGFLRTLSYEMRKFDYYPIVCWDAGLAQRRLDVYPNYKGYLDRLNESNGVDIEGKSEEPNEYLDEYRRQRREIIKILNKLAIPSLRFQGWEGDDLMRLVTMMSDESIVLTDDKDLIQLAKPNISIRRALRDELIAGPGHESTDWYQSLQRTDTNCMTLQKFFGKSNYEDMFEFVMVKAITGDPSDKIPSTTAGLERKYSVGAGRAKTIAKVIYHNPKTYMEVLKEMSENPKHLRDVYGKIPVNPIKGFLQRQDHFLRNMELVDLDRIEFPDEIKIQVAQEIVTSVNKSDYFGTLDLLGEHQINNLEVDSIVGKLNMLSMTAVS